MMLDGALYLVGERLGRALQPAPHVVNERGIEIFDLRRLFDLRFLSLRFLLRLLLHVTVTQVDPRVERLSLGLVLGEVGQIHHGGHEVSSPTGTKRVRTGLPRSATTRLVISAPTS